MTGKAHVHICPEVKAREGGWQVIVFDGRGGWDMISVEENKAEAQKEANRLRRVIKKIKNGTYRYPWSKK